MKLYLDSNVLISMIRDEINCGFRLLGEESKNFLLLCKKLKIELIFSETFFKEVKNIVGLEKEKTNELIKEQKLKSRFIFTEKIDKEKAKQIQKQAGIHFADALHVILALKSNCDAIISWNKKDFEKTQSLIDCKTPEEFIESFY